MLFSGYAEQRQSLAGIRLVSCGHIFASPKREICREHGRNDWLLFYVAKESETFFLPGETVTAEAGSAILFAPGEPQHHRYEGDKTAEFYYVHFQCDALPQDLTLSTSRVYAADPHRQFVALFEEMIDEVLQKSADYELICIARLLRLLALIQRKQAGESGDQKPRTRITDAILHMNRYCGSQLTLSDYAAMCCMSKYHFLRTFKQLTGTTPLEYRNAVRIENAKELLENSYLSIFEIGETLGYASPSYFSDAFKKQVGISPAAYRKTTSS